MMDRDRSIGVVVAGDASAFPVLVPFLSQLDGHTHTHNHPENDNNGYAKQHHEARCKAIESQEKGFGVCLSVRFHCQQMAMTSGTLSVDLVKDGRNSCFGNKQKETSGCQSTKAPKSEQNFWKTTFTQHRIKRHVDKQPHGDSR